MTPIARGAMGEVYRARDTTLDRTVAVKVLDSRYARDDELRRRFTREALAVARLSGNPHIVTIYDVGECGERPFIVMEYLAGGSLEDVLRREGAQAPGRVLGWLEDAANALDDAHRRGVVHRDVKPANLLLDARGAVSVVDFGIASAAGLDSLTQTGTVLGTAAYLSPEQANGDRTTAASDRYALGVVAFELLAGRRPFGGDSVAAEAAAHVSGEIPSICSVNEALPCELDPVFHRALAKDPAARYESCAEFVAALRAAFEHASAPMLVAAPYRASPARRRTPWLLPVLGLLVLAAIGGAVAGAWLAGGRRAALPPQRASVSVRTVTASGSTVEDTVTVPAPPPPTTTPATAAAPPTSTDPHTLNDQAWALMQNGNYQAALPLLQQAVQDLQGQTGDIYDAYANYNLGVVLIQLGRCADALPHLETAKQLEPSRHEVQDALKTARRC